MPNQDQDFAMIKAGAFSVYAEAGLPEAAWEKTFSDHIQRIVQAERSAALIPQIKQAMAASAAKAPAQKKV